MIDSWKHLVEYNGMVEIINNSVNQITGVSIDTRSLQNGNIFFALKTENADGHLYIPKAIEKGASVIVANKDWRYDATDITETCTFWLVDDTLKALQDMAALHRQQFNIPIVAITGSNGKTTTKEMLAHIMEADFNILKNPGNFNNHLGVPLTLYRLNKDHEIAIVEMGTNHRGEIERLCEIADPNIGTVVNIGNAHVGNFTSYNTLAVEKISLLDFINNKKGTVVLNTNDSRLRALQYDCEVIKIGIDPACKIYASEPEVNPERNGIRFSVNDKFDLNLSFPGFHNRINALLAIAIAEKLGVPVKESVQRLSSFLPSEQRMEVISVNGILMVNDCYNASPESMDEALRYVKELAVLQERPLVLILGDMLELGSSSEDFHLKILNSISIDAIHSMWLVGDSMRVLAKAVENFHFNGGLHYAVEAENWLSDLIKKIPVNALVLVKGSRGMHLEKVVSAIISRKG